jgi:leucyl aminopeptidase (aminopeptidase T)
VPGSSSQQAAQLAKNVLRNTLRLRSGENLIIESWSEALPWAKPFVAEARRIGAHPLLLYEDEEEFWDALKTGRSRQTGRVGSHEWAALEDASAYVFFFGPAEWPRLTDLPAKSRVGVAAYNAEWYRRASKAKIRGARMYLGRTSQLAADRWKLDLDTWREEMVRASLVPPADLHRLGSRIGERIRKGKLAQITHPNGTELQFRLGRFPIQLDDSLVDAADIKAGNTMATIPGGVVGAAVDHTSAEGEIVGNHTTYPESGPVTGVRWKFVDGHLAAQSYESGGEPLEAAYAKAPRSGRDRLGYFSVGLNPEITNLPQMEDQEIGALMFSLGGNSFRGGKNKSPFNAWMVVKDADLSIDGKPVLQSGRVVG